MRGTSWLFSSASSRCTRSQSARMVVWMVSWKAVMTSRAVRGFSGCSGGLAVVTHHLTAAPKPPQQPGIPRTAREFIIAFQDTIHTTIRADWPRMHLDEALEDSQAVPLT